MKIAKKYGKRNLKYKVDILLVESKSLVSLSSEGILWTKAQQTISHISDISY